MKTSASDPDIETLVSRIRRKELDLRPEFQRGEVWSDAKRQKLIDTILRGWQVPPIHVVSVSSTSELEVLDGQQRLAAIRDFAVDRLSIDGKIKPLNAEILQLDGRTFSTLSASWQRRFNQYPIRVFTVTEYEPDEPYELFYRLNQPTTLTSAEQRNAFFGPAREQVKKLVELAQASGLDRDAIGFSNSRMQYDDVLSRACMFAEAKSFHAKVTAGALNDKYRSKKPFADSVINVVEDAIRLLALGRATFGRQLRLNKATLLSWILFTASQDVTQLSGNDLAAFIDDFELRRRRRVSAHPGKELLSQQWLALYEDRASSRVNDTLSVASRDFVLWFFFAMSEASVHSNGPKLTRARDASRVVQENADQNRYLEAAAFVEKLLDTRKWDLVVS
jgi:hypothetical protein